MDKICDRNVLWGGNKEEENIGEAASCVEGCAIVLAGLKDGRRCAAEETTCVVGERIEGRAPALVSCREEC